MIALSLNEKILPGSLFNWYWSHIGAFLCTKIEKKGIKAQVLWLLRSKRCKREGFSKKNTESK
jgi:hypothetical protein